MPRASRQPAEFDGLAVTLDEGDAVPLYLQLYNELRRAILSGRLPGGVKVPSTRSLSQQLNVSRNTVTAAFEQLLSENYLESRAGSGTYVAPNLPDQCPSGMPVLIHSASHHETPPVVSQRAQRIQSIPFAASVAPPSWAKSAPRAFRMNMPAIDAFPYDIWQRLLTTRWQKASHFLLGYGPAAGYKPLREAIAAYVQASRAVRCEASQVIIVSGSQQGLDLITRVLLDPGDYVLHEDPGYNGARAAFLNADARIVPVPIDEEGIRIDSAPAHLQARCVYVTPSHQYPLGVTMSLRRRLSLLAWAQRTGAYIIEDDYNSEFRYEGRPITALQGLDAQQRVLYLGTFSKVLLPSLRIGYLIVPPNLVEAFTRARAFADWQSPQFGQAVLADFITEGHFARHIRRMRALYHERQGLLQDAARDRLAGLLTLQPAAAGMHLVGWLNSGVDDVEAAHAAVEHGVDAPPLSRLAIHPYPQPALLLGYACLNEQSIREGVEHLGQALERFSPTLSCKRCGAR